MNFLLDRKNNRNKTITSLLVLGGLFLIFFFRNPISYFLEFSSGKTMIFFSGVASSVSKPFVSISNSLRSKNSILAENILLKEKEAELSVKMSDHSLLLDENIKLKEILNRKKDKSNLVLSFILSKPYKTPYDTMVIDIGQNEGVKSRSRVFAFGNVAIGEVLETFPSFSKVQLYSSSGVKTDVVLSGKDIFLQTLGRGGGNFEITLPKDLVVEKGATVVLPGSESYILAILGDIISDPRDPFQKVLLTSPVNIQELKWVEIEK